MDTLRRWRAAAFGLGFFFVAGVVFAISINDADILLDSGDTLEEVLALIAEGQTVCKDGAGWISCAPGGGDTLPTLTDGQIVVGKTGLDPVAANLGGHADNLAVVEAAGALGVEIDNHDWQEYIDAWNMTAVGDCTQPQETEFGDGGGFWAGAIQCLDSPDSEIQGHLDIGEAVTFPPAVRFQVVGITLETTGFPRSIYWNCSCVMHAHSEIFASSDWGAPTLLTLTWSQTNSVSKNTSQLVVCAGSPTGPSEHMWWRCQMDADQTDSLGYTLGMRILYNADEIDQLKGN